MSDVVVVDDHLLTLHLTVLHPRDTVPQAAVLSARHGLNLLAADALAAALALEAQILVAAHDGPPTPGGCDLGRRRV